MLRRVTYVRKLVPSNLVGLLVDDIGDDAQKTKPLTLGERRKILHIRSILLTSSFQAIVFAELGPFTRTARELEHITLSQALSHEQRERI